MFRATGILLSALLISAAASAAPARIGPPPPSRTRVTVPVHYVSQRSETAYLREGPSFQHRILWVYKHKGYPFQVLSAYDVWRKVKTVDGTIGWMSANMLVDQRTVLVTGKERAGLWADDERRAKLVAYAMPGATARVEACAIRACRISAPGLKGWIDKDRIWGVGRDEVFK